MFFQGWGDQGPQHGRENGGGDLIGIRSTVFGKRFRLGRSRQPVLIDGANSWEQLDCARLPEGMFVSLIKSCVFLFHATTCGQAARQLVGRPAINAR